MPRHCIMPAKRSKAKFVNTMQQGMMHMSFMQARGTLPGLMTGFVKLKRVSMAERFISVLLTYLEMSRFYWMFNKQLYIWSQAENMRHCHRLHLIQNRGYR